MEVGVRELRDKLSSHLAEVQMGKTMTVTDHGRPIARLVPIEGMSKLDALRAAGVVTPAKRKKTLAPKTIRAKGMVSDLIAEQRR